MNSEKPNFNLNPSSQEQGEPVKSENEVAWEKKLAEVNEIADRLGKGVDEKIVSQLPLFVHN